ncbi:complexin-3-like [Engystomops pustulosus]|uniref:complexin-3-like n=1 Tax=Engystomops pustulosus TaxID=76066 RepID=UPI003AFADBA4
MTSVAKTLFGGPVKSISCCASAGAPQEQWPQSESRINIMRRWSSDDQHHRVVQPDTRRRDSLFAQQKAERAQMREHFREKYNLSKNTHDQQQLKAAGGNVRLSKDLRAVVRQDQTDSQDFSFTDLLADLRKSAQSSAAPLKPGARCLVM